jgi:hypothetical protein
MKTHKIIGFVLVAVLIGIAGFYSCEKTTPEPSASPNVITEKPMMIIAPGTWEVTSFQWHDKSDNDHFKEYTFQFNPGGLIVAYHNHVEEHGKWEKRNNILQLIFDIQPLNELSNNWTIVSHTAYSASLRGLSPTDDSSEFLTIEQVNSTEPK